jgi:lipid-A-disaccharide synthase
VAGEDGLRALEVADRIVEAMPPYAIYRAWRRLVALLDDVDAAVLIDYQDFNQLMARAARRRGKRVFYYVSPTVWAWRAGRIETMKRYVDHLAVVLPFEAPLYEAAGVPVTYVGHPLVDAPRPAGGRAAARAALGLDPLRHTVALLPGSRRFEVAALLPVLLDAAARLAAVRSAAGRPPLQFVLPLASTVARSQVDPLVAAAPVPVAVVAGGEDGRGPGPAARALAAADVAVTASGTATLECALAGTPMVVVYKVRPLTYALARRLIRVRFIGLVNLIAGRSVAPELIQDAATGERVAHQVATLLDDPARRTRAEADLAEVRAQLGAPGASPRAAGVLMKMVEG